MTFESHIDRNPKICGGEPVDGLGHETDTVKDEGLKGMVDSHSDGGLGIGHGD